jgi:hypothetical protein
MWPLSRRIMMRMHDITPDAAAESRSILESELDWLDSTLADAISQATASAEPTSPWPVY